MHVAKPTQMRQKKAALPSNPRPKPSAPARKGKSKPRLRDAAATQERILQSAIEEFAQHGFAGTRIDAIAQRADANVRMLYHYFGSKQALYVQVLETVFEDMRVQEQKLNLRNLEPIPAMMKLFDFTYAHFAVNPLFVRLLASENLLGGIHLKKSPHVSIISSPLTEAIRGILRRGEEEGIFRSEIDPLQLYVTMVSLSYFHISNGPTLSHLFNVKLDAPRWRAERHRHASEILRAYLVK